MENFLIEEFCCDAMALIIIIIILYFLQGNSISYKYSCYQEKPCIELKS